MISYIQKTLVNIAVSRWLPIFVLICGVAHCFWIAEKFAYTGYWDDTIIFVRHTANGPSNPIQFFLWLLNDYKSFDGNLGIGDLYGPWVMGIIKFGSSIGLLSNWFLILISNFALLGLSATLYFIAVKLGAKRSHSGIAAIIIYFSPQFIDQRTWYVAIQHTTTVLFLVLASYQTYAILNLRNGKKFNFNLVILNALLVLVSLGREVALPYGTLVIFVMLYTRMQNYQTIIVAWTLPILYWVQGIVVGRAGTHTQRAIDEFGLEHFQQQLLKYLDFPASKLLFVSMILILTLQFVLLKKSNKFNGDLKRQDIQSSNQGNNKFNLRANTTKKSLILYATVILLTVNDRSVATLATIFQPTGNTFRVSEISARWSITNVEPLPFYLSVMFIIFLLVNCTNIWHLLITPATLICTLPYLLSKSTAFEAQATPYGVVFMSRYAIYFAPALFFLLIGAFKHFELSQQSTKQFKMLLASLLPFITLFSLLNHASGLNFEIRQKKHEFASLFKLQYGPFKGAYCLNASAYKYLNLSYAASNFPDADTIFYADFRSGSKFIIDIECSIASLSLNELLILIASDISGEKQQPFDDLASEFEEHKITEEVGKEKFLALLNLLDLEKSFESLLLADLNS